MNKYLCVFICFFIGVIIFLLIRSYSSYRCKVVEGYCCKAVTPESKNCQDFFNSKTQCKNAKNKPNCKKICEATAVLNDYKCNNPKQINSYCNIKPYKCGNKGQCVVDESYKSPLSKSECEKSCGQMQCKDSEESSNDLPPNVSGFQVLNSTGKTINIEFDEVPPCLANSPENGGSCNPPDGNLECNGSPYSRIYGQRCNDCSWENHDAKLYLKSGTEWVDKTSEINTTTDKPYYTIDIGETIFFKFPIGNISMIDSDGNLVVNENKIQWCGLQTKNGKTSSICSGTGIQFKNSENSSIEYYTRFEFNINKPILTDKQLETQQAVCDPTVTKPKPQMCPSGEMCSSIQGCNLNTKHCNCPATSFKGIPYYANISNVDGINALLSASFENAKIKYNGSDENIYKKYNTQTISCYNSTLKNLLENCKNNNIDDCINPSHLNKYGEDVNKLACTNPNNDASGGMDKLLCHNIWDVDYNCNIDISDWKFIDTECKKPLGETKEFVNLARGWINNLNPILEENGYDISNVSSGSLTDICQGYNWAYDEQYCKYPGCNPGDNNVDNFIKTNLITNPYNPLKQIFESYYDNVDNDFKNEQDKIIINIEVFDVL